jgi:hypothetical protein
MSKIVVHCSFAKASLPLFFPDTQTYVKDCGPLQWTTLFDVGLCVGEKERE